MQHNVLLMRESDENVHIILWSSSIFILFHRLLLLLLYTLSVETFNRHEIKICLFGEKKHII